MANFTDHDRLRSAVRQGNVPTMLAVLLELTADERWTGTRYRPTRSRGMDDNATGGLPDDVQSEIRSALVDAVEHWWALGRPRGDGWTTRRSSGFSTSPAVRRCRRISRP